MRKYLFYCLSAIFFFCSYIGNAQAVYQYTSDVGGAPAFVTANLSATNLAKIGGGTNTSCASGFSGFTVPTSYTSYSPSDPAINVDLTPATGYTLKVTSVTVGIRRSGTGPNNCRLAYSVNGGVTWTDKGTDDFPNNSGCGSMTTASWTFPCAGGVVVGSPNYLKFRLFYFNSSNSTGTTQVMNLTINGTVTNACTPPTATISGSTSFCNSGSTTITFTGTPNATVTYNVNNGPNQTIVLNCSGTATLNTGVLNTTTVYNLVSASFGNACSQGLVGSATVTINVAPTITVSSTNPTTCSGNNGTITINGLTTGNSYTVHYTRNAVPMTFVATAVANAIVITGLTAGSYTNIFVTLNGCNSNTIAGPINLVDPAPPAISISSTTNPTTCGGSDGTITISGLVTGNSYVVNYMKNAVPQTLTGTAVANAIVITGLTAGSYTGFNVTINNCTSNTLAGPYVLTDPPAPTITSITSTNPTTCNGTDGTITLHGLLANTTYTLNYTLNNVPQGPLTVTSNMAGDIVISNLSAATYDNFTVARLNCISNVAGPVLLLSPIPPVISNVIFTDPTTCGGTDGTITLIGLFVNTNFSLYYNNTAGPVGPLPVSSDAAGQVIISNLPADVYSNIYVVRSNCTSNIVGPIALSAPLPPVITSVTTANPTSCSGTGSIILYGLLANTSYTASYSFNNNAPQSVTILTDASGNLTINGLPAGSYTNIGVSWLNCISNTFAGPYVLTDPAPPVIANTTFTNPTTCSGADGSITLTGLTANTTYILNYNENAIPQGPLNATTDASGNILIANLSSALYDNITVTFVNCVSNTVGPLTLVDPAAPLITSSAAQSPVNCGGLGSIALSGLLPSMSYTLNYDFNAVPQGPTTVTADASGNIVVSNLPAGVYSNVYLIRLACTSNIAGPFTITYPNPPAAPVTSDVTYCQGDVPQALTASGQNLKWYTTATGGTGLLSVVPVTNAPGSVTYYVSQTVNNCESDRALLTVTVKPKPTVPTTNNPAYTYCQFEAGATALAATGNNLQWYTQPTGGTPSLTAPTPNTNTAGAFTWYVSQSINGCESDRLPIVVTVNPKPQPPVVVDIRYCQGDVAMPLTAIGQNLQWYTSAIGGTPQSTPPLPSTANADSVTWYVSQSDKGCESDRAAITYIVYFKPDAAIKASKDIACQHDTISFTYTGNGAADFDYNWSIPFGAVIVAGSGQGPVLVQFNGSGQSTVSLTVNNHGCKSPTGTYTVDIKTAPEVSLSTPSEACPGDTVHIALSSANGAIAHYLWDFDGGHILIIKKQKVEGPYAIKWSDAGMHTVSLRVENDNGCFSKVSDMINIHPLPEAKILSVSNSNICAGDTITCSATTNDPKNEYRWLPLQYFDNGAGRGTAVMTGTIDFTSYITLQVTSSFGCVATDSLLINAPACCTVSFPTAFTPNGDGKNDKFRPITTVHQQVSYFRVFNRWGNIVYESLNQTSGWDGSVNGVAQDIGTYYYQVKYNCDGKMIEQNGDFILMR